MSSKRVHFHRCSRQLDSGKLRAEREEGDDAFTGIAVDPGASHLVGAAALDPVVRCGRRRKARPLGQIADRLAGVVEEVHSNSTVGTETVNLTRALLHFTLSYGGVTDYD